MPGDLYFVLEYRGRKTTGLNILLPTNFILVHDCILVEFPRLRMKTSKKSSVKIEINFKFVLKNHLQQFVRSA